MRPRWHTVDIRLRCQGILCHTGRRSKTGTADQTADEKRQKPKHWPNSSMHPAPYVTVSRMFSVEQPPPARTVDADPSGILTTQHTAIFSADHTSRVLAGQVSDQPERTFAPSRLAKGETPGCTNDPSWAYCQRDEPLTCARYEKHSYNLRIHDRSAIDSGSYRVRLPKRTHHDTDIRCESSLYPFWATVTPPDDPLNGSYEHSDTRCPNEGHLRRRCS